MSEAEEAVHPFKAMKMNKKATEHQISAFKHDFKECLSAHCTNYFTGMETCVDTRHRSHTKFSCVKQLFNAAKSSSMEESVT